MSIQEQIPMIEDCENRDTKMNDWQCGFIDSISIKMADGKGLTVNEINKLNETWEMVTENG